MKHKDMERLAYHYITEKGGKAGHPRLQEILTRIVGDLFKAIDDLDITEDEVWTGLDFLVEAGKQGEILLVAPGIGLDRFLDIRLEEAEALYGIAGGTPRTIEGPLYVHGAPISQGYARLDDGTEEDAEVLIMRGVVYSANSQPLPGAVVEVWHANTQGNYSYFDQTQSDYHLRRTIVCDENGGYSLRTIFPSGYGVPEGGPTEKLMQALGRHGQRPPHIHFFVHAEGFRKLTTQITLPGSPYTHDDYAFADRYALIPEIRRVTDSDALEELGVDKPCGVIDFDFRLNPEVEGAPPSEVERARAVPE